ncbi:excisionase family protein [Serratia liquefaciens]|jgi:hypothetical protein|nr:excisionase family protein [Serratia liquefaciens]
MSTVDLSALQGIKIPALEGMGVFIIQPNEWLTKEWLILVTGISEGKIRAYRRKGAWRQGKEWVLVATDGDNKPNSDTMYHLPTINAWFATQRGRQPTD